MASIYCQTLKWTHSFSTTQPNCFYTTIYPVAKESYLHLATAEYYSFPTSLSCHVKGERIHSNSAGEGDGEGVLCRSGLGWMVNIDDLCTQQTECGGQGCLVIIQGLESYLYS